jgi:methionyl-tRNA formyltransferase
MRAVIVGAVDSTAVALEEVAHASGWEVSALVTLPPELSRRHSDYRDLSPRARELGAEVIHAPDSNAPEIVDAVRAIEPAYVFVIGWSQICRSNFREAVGNRVLGFHPAPLPRLRGRGVIPWTILNQEPITASTLFQIDDGMDTGAVLAQKFFHVAPDETATTLVAKHLAALTGMLRDLLPALARGEAQAILQDERLATWAARRIPADGLLDWRRPAGDLWRLIRASTRPYPGAFTTSRGQRLTIFAAEPSDLGERYLGVPGQVIACAEGSFAVSCGDGRALRATDWGSADGAPPKLHARLGGASVPGSV